MLTREHESVNIREILEFSTHTNGVQVESDGTFALAIVENLPLAGGNAYTHPFLVVVNVF